MLDIHYSRRLLRKDPTFTLVVALTLAMGIGGSTALFTIVHNVLLRPLAIPDSDQVLLVYNSYPKAGIEHVGAAASDYADRLHGVTTFEEQALLDFQNPSLDVDASGALLPSPYTPCEQRRHCSVSFALARWPDARSRTRKTSLATPRSWCRRPAWRNNGSAPAARSAERFGSMAYPTISD